MVNYHYVVLIKHVDSDQLVLGLICFLVVKDLCEIVFFFLIILQSTERSKSFVNGVSCALSFLWDGAQLDHQENRGDSNH
jgi:hypothetical protein